MGLFSFKSKTDPSSFNWVKLTEKNQLNDLIRESYVTPVLFFKHSIRCSISSMAKNRLENNWNMENVVPVYLDLINFRNLSNQLAEEFGVVHASPQVILVKDGKCIFTASHNAIDVESIENNI